MGDHVLEKAIYDTLRYFDLFEMPLTSTQVWRCLIIDPQGEMPVRWGGHKQVGLQDVQKTLVDSEWLQGRVQTQWGYWFLSGRDHLVRICLDRHVRAQMKWKVLLRVARFLAVLPFVRALAGSGSLAIDNTKKSSDLDLFVIVKSGRIWTARLLLLTVTQLLGRRRKYWNVQAPDMVCLNHYISDEHLKMSSQVVNLYTAVQYTLHVPLSGLGTLHQFQAVNAGWIHRYVMVPALPHVHHRYTVKVPNGAMALKKHLEALLLEPVGEAVERWARRLQQNVIRSHEIPGRAGRVVINEQELAFHPDTKVPGILAQFYEEAGQRQLSL